MLTSISWLRYISIEIMKLWNCKSLCKINNYQKKYLVFIFMYFQVKIDKKRSLVFISDVELDDFFVMAHDLHVYISWKNQGFKWNQTIFLFFIHNLNNNNFKKIYISAELSLHAEDWYFDDKAPFVKLLGVVVGGFGEGWTNSYLG